MAKRIKHPSTIPGSFYRPLGQLLAGFTYTELFMQSIAWKALKIRNFKTARLLTIGRNALDQEKLFLSLTDRWIKQPQDIAEIESLHGEIQVIRAFRNKLAHGYWGYKPGEHPRRWRLYYLRENDQKIYTPHIYITEKDLEGWVDRLTKVNARMKALHKKLRAPAP